MRSQTYATYPTVGGRAVNLRYQPLPQTPDDPPDGVYADCTGCGTRRGADGEHRTRDWAIHHAKQCVKPHA